MSNGLMYVCMACLFMELWLTLDCSGRAWWLCEPRNVYICDCPSRGWRKCVRWWIVQRHLECVRDDIDIDSCITNILHILRFVWNLDVCGDVDFLHSNQLCGCVCEYTVCIRYRNSLPETDNWMQVRCWEWCYLLPIGNGLRCNYLV